MSPESYPLTRAQLKRTKVSTTRSALSPDRIGAGDTFREWQPYVDLVGLMEVVTIGVTLHEHVACARNVAPKVWILLV